MDNAHIEQQADVQINREIHMKIHSKKEKSTKKKMKEIRKEETKLMHKYNDKLMAARQDIMDQEDIINRGVLLKTMMSHSNKQYKMEKLIQEKIANKYTREGEGQRRHGRRMRRQ